MKKKFIVRLSEEEHQDLTNLVRKGKVAAYKRTHAQILLLADEGEHGPNHRDKEVAERVGVNHRTVSKLRQRCVEKRITLVMDNLSTHTGASLYKSFGPQVARRLLEKLEFVYTPKHGSWLNMAECEFSVLSRQCLDRRLPDIDTVRSEVNAWTVSRNQAGATVNWRFATEDARIKLKQLYPITAGVN